MGGTRTILARSLGGTAVAPHLSAPDPALELAVAAEVEEIPSPSAPVPSPAQAGVSRFAPSHIVSRQVEKTLERARALIAKKREMPPREVTDQLGIDGHLYNQRVYGMPWETRLVIIGERGLRLETDPRDTMVLSADMVFRHYTDTGGLRAILRSRRLVPGPWPHSYGGGERWVDLIGAFLTTPRYKPGDILPADSVYYVDLSLLPGTGLLDLSPRIGRRKKRDQYFMIPGIPRERAWYRRDYREWVKAGRPRGKNSKEFQEIFAQGGFPKPSRIPIVVLDSGRL